MLDAQMLPDSGISDKLNPLGYNVSGPGAALAIVDFLTLLVERDRFKWHGCWAWDSVPLVWDVISLYSLRFDGYASDPGLGR